MRTAAKIGLVFLLSVVAILLLMYGGQLFFYSVVPAAGDVSYDTPFTMRTAVLGSGIYAAIVARRRSKTVWGATASLSAEANPPRSDVLRYMVWFGVPGVFCSVTLVLMLTETIPLADRFYPLVSVLFGPLLLFFVILGASLGEIPVFQLIWAIASSFGYFWILGTPAGKLLGLLPADAERRILWIDQSVLVGLHLLWSFAVLQML